MRNCFTCMWDITWVSTACQRSSSLSTKMKKVMYLSIFLFLHINVYWWNVCNKAICQNFHNSACVHVCVRACERTCMCMFIRHARECVFVRYVYCGRPWPAAYINFNQNTHQIQVSTKPLCRAQAIFYSLSNNEWGTKYRELTYSAN